MTMKLGMITVDTTDALALARWWAEQTGGQILQENQGWYVVTQLPSGLRLSFQKVDIPSPGKNRIHLDVAPELGEDQQAALRELIAAGARPADVGQDDTVSWHVLTDPESNEFCLLTPR